MTDVGVPVPLALGKRLDDLAMLAKSPLLAPLSLRELGTLLDSLDQVAIPAGSVVPLTGAGEYVYFILEGEAHARRGQVETRPLRPADHFGALALVGVRDRVSVIDAVTPLRLARLSRARFNALVSSHPLLGVHVLTALGAQMAGELASMTESVGVLLRTRSMPRRTQVKIERDTGTEIVPMGAPIGVLLAQESAESPIVAGLLDAKPVSLDTPVTSDARVAPIARASWEGGEIYRRSVGLLLLEAAHRVAPDVAVHLGPVVGTSQIVRLRRAEHEDRDEHARLLLRAMRTIRGEKAAFREELWTVDEARSMFAERGWDDAAALLRSSHEPTVTLLSCGDVYAVRTGPVLPSVERITDVALTTHADGWMLDLGADASAQSPDASPVRFGSAMELRHRQWLDAMGIDSVGHFNDACISGRVSQLIRISEGFHEKSIGEIADAIARREGTRVICIAGPSSSGKTTFIKRLTVQLEVDGLHPVNVSLDDYYRDRRSLRTDDTGSVDYEALDAIDVTLVQSQVRRALAGERVRTARFDFRTGESHPEGGSEIAVGPKDVLLIEGIHGLNPALLADAVSANDVFRVFVHCGTALPLDRLTTVAAPDIRLLRRIVRDRHTRGYSAAENIARWPQVRRGEERSIYPFLAQADAVFDTSLVYEPAVLKVFAERYLLEVPERDPAFTTAYRLRQVVERFVAIYPDHVPPTSILREFIGGSGFEY